MADGRGIHYHQDAQGRCGCRDRYGSKTTPEARAPLSAAFG